MNLMLQKPWIGGLFDDIDNLFTGTRRTNQPFYVSGEGMTDRGDKYRIVMAVPGASRKDVQVEISDNELLINVQKQDKRNGSEWHAMKVSRSFTLPDDSDPKGIFATCRDGLLTIDIPKAKPKNHRTIRIESAGSSTPEPNRKSFFRKLMDLFAAKK